MWADGAWKFSINGHVVKTILVEGEEFSEEDGTTWARMKYGEFPDKVGNKSCNLEIYKEFTKDTGYGVVFENGRKILLDNGGVLDWMTEEERNSMENEKDPVSDIPNDYEKNPGQDGKILWLCGATGMGKTTTAKLLKEQEGFVYYEGDCFTFGLNPYVGAAPKGSSHFGTRALSGISPQRTSVCKTVLVEGYTKFLKGEKVKEKVWEDFYSLLCEDIQTERAKIGGNWVVTQAVYTKAAREMIRNKLGDCVLLVVLESGEEGMQLDRLAIRASELSREPIEESKKKMGAFTGYHESAEDHEPNTVKIQVLQSMTPDEVLGRVKQSFSNWDS